MKLLLLIFALTFSISVSAYEACVQRVQKSLREQIVCRIDFYNMLIGYDISGKVEKESERFKIYVDKREKLLKDFDSKLINESEASRQFKILEQKFIDDTSEESKITNAKAVQFNNAVDASNNGKYAEAFKLFKPLAENGDAQAQFNIGVSYQYGLGVKKNFNQAINWYKKALEKGNPKAQNNLGNMYFQGEGVTQDYTEAIGLYKLSAAQGDNQALYNMGLMYKQGKGVTQDYIHAHMWMNLAAAKGHSDALKGRDELASNMSQVQIAEAQKLARDCEKLSYINCN